MDDITVVTPETPRQSDATTGDSLTVPLKRELAPIQTNAPLQIRTPPPQQQSLDTIDIPVGTLQSQLLTL